MPSQDQKALTVCFYFYVFATHRVASLKELLTAMSLPVVHLSCSTWTSLSMIPIRRNSNNAFLGWYASEVKKVLDKGEKVHISLQTSIIKELHANWTIKTQ